MSGCLENLDLVQYADGELPPVDAARVSRHLASCQACQRRLLAFEDMDLIIGAGAIEAYGAARQAPSSELLARLVRLGTLSSRQSNAEDEVAPAPVTPLAGQTSRRLSRRLRPEGLQSPVPLLLPLAIAAALLLLASIFVVRNLRDGDDASSIARKSPADRGSPAPSPVDRPGLSPDAGTKPDAVEPEPELDHQPSPVEEGSSSLPPHPDQESGDPADPADTLETPVDVAGTVPRASSTGVEPGSTEKTRADLEAATLALRTLEAGEKTISIRDVQGALVLVRGGEFGEPGEVPLESVRTVGPTEIVRASKGGGALTLGTTADLCLRAGTEVALSRTERGPRVRLLDGEIHVDFLAGGVDATLEVVTPGRRMEVSGTRFACKFAGEITALAVAEGSLRLPNGRSVEAAQGFSATLAEPDEALVVEKVNWTKAGGWANALRARRELVLHWDFENRGSPFSGQVVSDPVQEGRFALRAGRLEGNKYWGVEAVAPDHHPRIRHAAGTFIEFSVYLGSESAFLVQAKNQKQKLHFAKIFKRGAIPHGRWVRVRLYLDELLPYQDKTKRLESGDVLGQLGFYAGTPDDPVQMVLDDVMVVARQ